MLFPVWRYIFNLLIRDLYSWKETLGPSRINVLLERDGEGEVGIKTDRKKKGGGEGGEVTRCVFRLRNSTVKFH